MDQLSIKNNNNVDMNNQIPKYVDQSAKFDAQRLSAAKSKYSQRRVDYLLSGDQRSRHFCTKMLQEMTKSRNRNRSHDQAKELVEIQDH